MKIIFKKQNDAGEVIAVVTKEYRITPVIHESGIEQWIISCDGRTLASWSTLEMAKKNFRGMVL